MRRICSALKRTRKDERGVEAAAMIFVLPVLIILVIGLIDIGWMIKTRMVVQNIAQDAVRAAAADGGNWNPRTNDQGTAWDQWALNRLWDGSHCTQSSCDRRPTVNCAQVTLVGETAPRGLQMAPRAGDLISCTVVYPYKPINEPLLNSPMGLGIGSMLKDFTITVSYRSEVGTAG